MHFASWSLTNGEYWVSFKVLQKIVTETPWMSEIFSIVNIMPLTLFSRRELNVYNIIRSLQWINETRQLYIKWGILSYQNAFKMCVAKSLDAWRLGPGLAWSSRWRMRCIKRLSPWEQTFWSFLNFDTAFLKIHEIRMYRKNKLVHL